MLRRLVSAQILPFRTVGFFLAVNQNTPKKFGVRYFYEQSAVLEKPHEAGLASGRARSTLDAFRRGARTTQHQDERHPAQLRHSAQSFPIRWCFPERREDIAGRIVTYLASQT